MSTHHLLHYRVRIRVVNQINVIFKAFSDSVFMDFTGNFVISSNILTTCVEPDGNIHEHPVTEAPDKEPEVGAQNWGNTEMNLGIWDWSRCHLRGIVARIPMEKYPAACVKMWVSFGISSQVLMLGVQVIPPSRLQGKRGAVKNWLTNDNEASPLTRRRN